MKPRLIHALLLAAFVGVPAISHGYPIPASERTTLTSLASQYRDGYQVNGAGTVFTHYFQLRPDNQWGPAQELRLDPAAVKNLMQGGKAQLAGVNGTTNQTEYYTGNGQNLTAHATNYGWGFQYTRTFDGSNVEIDVELKFDWRLTSLTPAQQLTQMAAWESNIEGWWNNRYSIVKDELYWFGIVFDVTFGGYDDGQGGKEFDQQVVVRPGNGRADMGNWYLSDAAQTNAHEFGHMLGLFDEYWSGALDTGKLGADGLPVTDYSYLMGANKNSLAYGGGMKKAYYLPFMTWLDSLDEDPDQRYALIPEPGTLFLLAAGLLGIAIPGAIGKRRFGQTPSNANA